MRINPFGVINYSRGSMFVFFNGNDFLQLNEKGKLRYAGRGDEIEHKILKYKIKNTLNIKNHINFNYCIIDNKFMIKVGLNNKFNVGTIILKYLDDKGFLKETEIQQNIAYRIEHKWSSENIYDL